MKTEGDFITFDDNSAFIQEVFAKINPNEVYEIRKLVMCLN